MSLNIQNDIIHQLYIWVTLARQPEKNNHTACAKDLTRHSATASSQLELSNLCKKIPNRALSRRNIAGGHLLGSPPSSSSSLTSFLVGSGGECIYMQTGIGRGKVRSTGVLEK